MLNHYQIGTLVSLLGSIILAGVAIYLDTKNHKLSNKIYWLNLGLERADSWTSFTKNYVAILEESLEVYRRLSDKLVSHHTSSTYIHLKIRSDFALDGDKEKTIEQITAILRDKL